VEPDVSVSKRTVRFSELRAVIGCNRYRAEVSVDVSTADSVYVVSELSAIACPGVAAPPTFAHVPTLVDAAPANVVASPDVGTRISVVTVVDRLFASVTTHCRMYRSPAEPEVRLTVFVDAPLRVGPPEVGYTYDHA
jgi:hypothetical protein